MKKRLLILSTICVLAFGMSACGASEDASSSSEVTTSTENTEATDATVATENAEATDATEATENAEATDATEATENAEATDATEATENAEATDTTEVTENTEATDATEEADDELTLTFDIPEGFVESEENYYVYEDGTKMSNINTLSLPNDGSFDSVNAEALLTATEAQLEAAAGTELTLSLVTEESYDIDGYRAYKYAIEYTMLEIDFYQLQCIIETPDALHFVTFSDINNEGYYDAFNAAADTIRFE